MFQIISRHLQDSCYQLNQQIRVLNNELEELEQVLAALSSLSGMEEIYTNLKSQKNSIQEEYDGLYQMMQALNKILLNYMKCEDRIISECEQDVYYFEWKEVGKIYIDYQSSLIS